MEEAVEAVEGECGKLAGQFSVGPVFERIGQRVQSSSPRRSMSANRAVTAFFIPANGPDCNPCSAVQTPSLAMPEV